MIRIAPALAALVLASLAGCFQSHASDQQELAGTDCYSCHQRDYAATTAPVHPATPGVFSTACDGCHRTIGWKPALEGLHSEAFIIATGPHAPFGCLECHDLATAQPSKAGANTSCIQCHPDDAHQGETHAGVTTVTGAPYRYESTIPNFCLSCHPDGTAAAHPDRLFARTGNHAVPCGDCHDRTAGSDKQGANVTCVDARCHHTLSVSDGIDHHGTLDYQSARGNGTSRNFCHQCHS
ncbi:MAG TPA: hypothetical protein VFK02_11195 [Kofleriaceae bacterium]|nr:hypothetical protein [Kofleriaceae bacterium]